MLFHQIIMNSLYVCQSVSWLLPYLNSRYIGLSLFPLDVLNTTLWRHSLVVCTIVPNTSGFYVCLSVCQLAYFFTEIRQLQGYLQQWIRYLTEIFWGYSLNIPKLVVPNILKFLVCLSVCQLAYFIIEIRLNFDKFSYGGYIFLKFV